MGERSGAPSGFSPASIVISKPPVAVQLPQPDVSANRDAPQRVGLTQRPGRAPAFYVTIAAATLVGAALNFTPLDPVKALIWSAIINGVAAVPIMAMIMLMASRRAVMGEFALTKRLVVLGWLATAVMGAAAAGMFATWGS